MMKMTTRGRRALRCQQELHLVVLKHLVQPDVYQPDDCQNQSAEIQKRVHLSQL